MPKFKYILVVILTLLSACSNYECPLPEFATKTKYYVIEMSRQGLSSSINLNLDSNEKISLFTFYIGSIEHDEPISNITSVFELEIVQENTEVIYQETKSIDNFLNGNHVYFYREADLPFNNCGYYFAESFHEFKIDRNYFQTSVSVNYKHYLINNNNDILKESTVATTTHYIKTGDYLKLQEYSYLTLQKEK
jgi:hypothetical protein